MPQNRDISITLGKLTLNLKYEAENLYALSEITGTPWLEFIQGMSPRKGEKKRDAGARVSDLSKVVPLIMAGLAHHDEYDGLTDRELRRKVCAQLDADARHRGVPLIQVTAEALARIMPFVAQTLIPPGSEQKKSKKTSPPASRAVKHSTKKS